MKILIGLMMALPAFLLSAADAVRLEENGVIAVDGVCRTWLLHRDRSWNVREQRRVSGATAGREGDGAAYRFPLAGFDVLQTVRPDGENAFRISWRLEAGGPVGTNSVYLLTQVFSTLAEKNEVRLDGRRIAFPERFTPSFTQSRPGVRELVLPLDTGFLEWRFETPVTVKLEDMREWNIQSFDVRILLNPDRGDLRASSLDARLRFVPYRTKPVSLAAAPAGEPEEKLPGGALPAGGVSFRHVKFECGRTVCLNRANPEAVLDVPAGSRSLVLLHAAGKAYAGSIGSILVEGRSGERAEIPVVAGRSVGSFRDPAELPEAFVAQESPEGGFCAASFELPDFDISRVTLKADGSADWLVAAASVSPQRIPLRPVRREFVAAPGRNWRRFVPKLDVAPGSALDFSAVAGVDAPAGKHGRVVVRNGRFEFMDRPGPVRFYGVNFCFSANFLTREQCDAIAPRLARLGFNAVRLHHFDRDLVKKSAADSHTIDPEALDRLDYLIASLKKAGIYVTLDLFTIRTCLPGEFADFPEGLRKSDGSNYKMAVMLHPEVRAKFQEFAERLLTHRNPYTGLTWAEDPAFSTVSVLNENSILHIYDRSIPAVKRHAEKLFRAYCAEKRLRVAPETERTLFREFLTVKYAQYWDEMSGFLRRIGVQAPLTEQNYCSYPHLIEQRRNYDYVDNHKYWDHPNFGGRDWALPMHFLNESALDYRLRLPKWLGSPRLFGKPYTVSELNFCYPNRFRAEGAVICGALAALQDWDGIYWFDYADSAGRMFSDREFRLRIFDICNDMTRLLPARIGAALFLRRDAASAAGAYPVAVDVRSKSAGETRYPEAAEDLIFRGRTGSVLVRDGRPADPLPAGTKLVSSLDGVLKRAPYPVSDPAKVKLEPRFRSDTGELSVDFERKTFSAVTARTEAGVFPAGGSFDGRYFHVRSKKAFGVTAAVALNGASLREAGRILILHVTDCRQEGSVFDSEKLAVLKSYGDKSTVIGEHGVCEMRLTVPVADWKLYALDFDGARIGKVPFRYRDGSLEFTADTFREPGRVVFAYELTGTESAERAGGRP